MLCSRSETGPAFPQHPPLNTPEVFECTCVHTICATHSPDMSGQEVRIFTPTRGAYAHGGNDRVYACSCRNKCRIWIGSHCRSNPDWYRSIYEHISLIFPRPRKRQIYPAWEQHNPVWQVSPPLLPHVSIEVPSAAFPEDEFSEAEGAGSDGVVSAVEESPLCSSSPSVTGGAGPAGSSFRLAGLGGIYELADGGPWNWPE